jgi:hypothetical protein
MTLLLGSARMSGRYASIWVVPQKLKAFVPVLGTMALFFYLKLKYGGRNYEKVT